MPSQYLEGVKVGRETNPWANAISMVNETIAEKRAFDQKLEFQARELRGLFENLGKKHEYDKEIQRIEGEQGLAKQRLSGEQDIEKEFAKGEIEGSLRPVQREKSQQSGMMSLTSGGEGDVEGRPISMAERVVQQSGLGRVKSPSGREYEQTGQPAMTATERNYKKKQQKEFVEEYAENNTNLNFINETEPLIQTLPVGLVGKVKTEWMKNFDANNPILGNWQKVKSILTGTTVLQSLKLKGAISDREFEEFKKSVANDDLSSIPRIQSAFDRYRKIIESDNKAKVDAYYKQFGEYPRGGEEVSQGDFNVQNMSDEELMEIAR